MQDEIEVLSQHSLVGRQLSEVSGMRLESCQSCESGSLPGVDTMENPSFYSRGPETSTSQRQVPQVHDDEVTR